MRASPILLFTSLALFSVSAFAGVLIEPYGGGQFSGDLKMPDSQAIGASSYTSFIYGGRVGWDFGGLAVGGEYLGDNGVTVQVQGSNQWGSADTTLNMSNTNYGGFLSYEFFSPLMIRLVGTFFSTSQAHLKHVSSGSTDADFVEQGYGYKGEIATHVSHYLSLGIAYYYLVFTQQKDNLTGRTSSQTPVGVASAAMAVLSIPLEL